MARFFKKRDDHVGKPPGTLTFVGDKKSDHTLIRMIHYDQDHLEELEIGTVEDLIPYKSKPGTSWINIDGLHDIDLIKSVGEIFELNDLVLEDILNTTQRPKLEEHEGALFVVVKMLRKEEHQTQLLSEQLSMVFNDKLLITFQEQSGDTFEPVRDRLRAGRIRIRSSGANFLAYSLIDTLTDNYIKIIEDKAELIEQNELKILQEPEPECVEVINGLKQEMNYLRKAIRPVKEIVIKWMKIDAENSKPQLRQFLDDLFDHVLSITEAIDTYGDMLSDQLNIYHTLVSNKMNDVMKVLTIFASIFIPLTFVAGIYGTNFEYFPELQFRYAYFIFWGILILIALIMLYYFRKKKWL